MSGPFTSSNDAASPHELGALLSPEAERSEWLAVEMQRHEPAVRGYLRNQFPSIDADDVLQESYLKILRAKAATGIISIKAYFFSVARNTARTLFRRRQIYSRTDVNELPDSLVLDEAHDAAETANSHLRLELVIEAIDRLPLRCRQIVSLAVLEGQLSAEIATRLGLSESTVRVQLARGVKKCAEFMRMKGERG
jgi:RNA polymerase sigma-70 factor (ECF subfamily)